MDELTVGELFAGIGGFGLGLERAGLRVRWQCELDEWCRRVLQKHWPDVTRYGDVRTLGRSEHPEPVDVLCGGFPCQPVSTAGKRRAQADERWLWPEFARVIRMVRPRYVIVENVPGLLTPVRAGREPGDVDTRPVIGAAPVAEVLGDLAACGYDAEWDCIPASSVGARHIRDRVWIVAYPARDVADADGAGRGERWGAEPVRAEHAPPQRGGEAGSVADADGSRLEHLREGQARIFGRAGRNATSDRGLTGRGAAEWWTVEPGMGRVADGIPHRVDRLRGLGNAVVPQVVEYIGRLIMEDHCGRA